MRSERQALADIAKACDKRGRVVTTFELRAIIADVQPEPAPAGGTIDRDALVATLFETMHLSSMSAVADRILALVRPVEGVVVLTHEEAHLARSWYTRLPIAVTVQDVALAQRLEAAL